MYNDEEKIRSKNSSLRVQRRIRKSKNNIWIRGTRKEVKENGGKQVIQYSITNSEGKEGYNESGKNAIDKEEVVKDSRRE